MASTGPAKQPNRRGPVRSPRSLAAERATTTRRIRAGRFTATPFPGARFPSKEALDRATLRWRELGSPKTTPSQHLYGNQRWFLTIKIKDTDTDSFRLVGLFFSEIPTLAQIDDAIENLERDPRYPENLEYVQTMGVRYSTR